MAKQAQQIKAWSFSRYNVYKQCPLKAKLKFIDKIEEPSNDAMRRGSEVHDKCEHYVKGKLSRLPKDLAEFKNFFQDMRKAFKGKKRAMTVEDTWAFTSDWDETVWNDWLKCWVRIKLDLGHFEDESTLIITDYKTGKFRPMKNEEYVEQLELYGLGALLKHPQKDLVVKPRLMYLDEGRIYPDPDQGEDEIVFTQKDLPRLKKLWAKRVRPMLNDKRFAPRPNNLCSWCHYRAENKANGGGQCKF